MQLNSKRDNKMARKAKVVAIDWKARCDELTARIEQAEQDHLTKGVRSYFADICVSLENMADEMPSRHWPDFSNEEFETLYCYINSDAGPRMAEAGVDPAAYGVLY